MQVGMVKRLSATSDASKPSGKCGAPAPDRAERNHPSQLTAPPRCLNSRDLTSNVLIITTHQILIRDYRKARLCQDDHVARTTKRIRPMSRRGIHPLLMGMDKPKPVLKAKSKPAEEKQSDLSGYESAQRKRFLRALSEEAKQEEAQARRSLLNLERQS